MKTIERSKHEIDGYSAGSSGYRHGCRCDECRASNRKYQQKRRATDETPTVQTLPSVEQVSIAEPPAIVEPIQESAAAIATPEAASIAAATVRDETTPHKIIEALNSSDTNDTLIYEDGGEGWELQELALILPSMADVTCQISRGKLYVSPIASEIIPDDSSPIAMPMSMTITTPQRTSNHPAQPRIVPKAPTAVPASPRLVSRAAAPTVPGTSHRAPISHTRNANTVEPFSL